MLRRFVWIIICVPLALLVVGAGAAFSLPATRHVVVAWWHLPDRLPALADNGLVHYEPGAEDYARDVAALLPAALARVEAAHGRPFTHPVTLGAYASMDAFVAANGTGSAAPVASAVFGRVNLSPKLSFQQHRRLPAILTHELSHAHIEGWIGDRRYVALPNWFKEGLAVVVSGGGGAELVSEEEAWAAIRDGDEIAIDDAGSILNPTDIRFAKAPSQQDPAWHPVVLAYRESGMFVSYLRASDGPAFARMMNAILDGRAFAEAVSLGYHDDVSSLWQRFLKSGPGQKS